MPINVSVKNVPDEVMEKLRESAKCHHRSIQGELLAIIEEVTGPAKFSLDQAEVRLKALGFGTGDDSTSWIREQRHAR